MSRKETKRGRKQKDINCFKSTRPTEHDIIQQRKGMKYDRCYNVDDSWKHNTKWKKAVTKDHVLYIIPFIWKVQNPQLHRDRRYRVRHDRAANNVLYTLLRQKVD